MTDTPVDSRMVRARVSLLQSHAFWGTLAMYLTVIEDPNVETMSTNGDYLKYNPTFLDELTELETEGVYAHEVSHNAYLHHTRRGNRDPEMWNEAADYAINRDLLRAGFTLPEGALVDPRFDGMSAEEIYSVLDFEKKQEQQQAQQQPGADQGKPDKGQQQGKPQPGQDKSQPGQKPGEGKPGQSQSGQPQPGQSGQGQPGKDKGRCGWVEDAAPAGNAAAASLAEAEQRVRVMQAMGVEKGKNAGELPESLTQMFEAVRKRTEDWRAILRRFIDEQSRVTYSWAKPNRRMIPFDFIIPGMVPDGLNHLGVIWDSSGSTCDPETAQNFNAQLQAALDEGCTRKITLICCDTTVKARYDFEEGEQLDFKVVGGGGTKFTPALKWFAENEPDVSAIIYFTDLDCHDFGYEPWCPTIWAAHGPADKIRERAKRVKFGEVIHLIN